MERPEINLAAQIDVSDALVESETACYGVASDRVLEVCSFASDVIR
jgi:hypothetical protein